MGLSKFLYTAIICCMFVCGCTQDSFDMHEGYYTAEGIAFDADGWKEFITIYVSNGRIVTVEYNAKNSSGFIKSWDVEHMRKMKSETGTYPNKYARLYAAELLTRQDPQEVKALPGAHAFHASFQLLARAAIDQATSGDKKVVFVNLQAAHTQK